MTNARCPWAGGVEFLCWRYPMSGEETGRGRSSAGASGEYPLAVIAGLVPVMMLARLSRRRAFAWDKSVEGVDPMARDLLLVEPAGAPDKPRGKA